MSDFIVVHVKKLPYDKYIGRGAGKYGEWGNPYSHLPLNKSLALYQTETVEESVESFKFLMSKFPKLVSKAQEDLAGCTLGCWCGNFNLASLNEPLRCHGQPLYVFANKIEPFYSQWMGEEPPSERLIKVYKDWVAKHG